MQSLCHQRESMPLLRIHRHRLSGFRAKVRRVERIDIGHKPPESHVGTQRGLRGSVHVPARQRRVADGVAAMRLLCRSADALRHRGDARSSLIRQALRGREVAHGLSNRLAVVSVSATSCSQQSSDIHHSCVHSGVVEDERAGQLDAQLTRQHVAQLRCAQ